MENWFLADRASLQAFFAPGFQPNELPPAARAVESISKGETYQALSKATRHCKTKSAYGKGEHSFKVLASIDAALVMAASPWARRPMTKPGATWAVDSAVDLWGRVQGRPFLRRSTSDESVLEP